MTRKTTLLFILLFSLKNLFSQESTASKNVSSFTIDAPQLNCTKKIWLYLPNEYATSKKKYPVIYMHDAQNLFDAETSYVGEWNIDEKLDSLNAQVIVVTHLAQVAAFADRHLTVVKSSEAGFTSSDVHVLDENARSEELARMLSGLSDSETARTHAKELRDLDKNS
jgi:predicted peptidase